MPQAPVLAKKIDLTTVTSGLFRLEQVDRASLQALKNNGYEFEYFDPGHDSLLCGIDDNGHITDVTSQSWRHRTHADEHQARRARWDDTVKMTTTTLNSTDVDGLQQALHERIINWTTLWSHYGELKLRRLAFSAHVTRQRARDQIANYLFGRDRHTVLFIGDQATRTGYRGHPGYPVTALRDHLASTGIVILVDEYRTSATCSDCHDFVDMDQYKYPYCKYCQHRWHRDVNAACNIKAIVDAYVAGRGRPSHLVRRSKSAIKYAPII